MTGTKKSKRKDKANLTLRTGESQRKNGGYDYRWTDQNGKRHSLYAKTLDELRVAEAQIVRDQQDHIKAEAHYVTLNDLFDLWKQLKRGLKDNTFQNYLYLYGVFIKPILGRKRISSLMKTDIKRFYNTLVDERGLTISTVDNIHTVLHQVLDMAVDDLFIRQNPANNVLKELKQSRSSETEKRRALTVPEQERFLRFLRSSPQYSHWYPVFAIMLGTGMRVGEAVGLRWCDVDLEQGMIDINHTLVYYKHETNGCYCNIHTPKTKNGMRQIPMLDFVRDAFLEEQRRQQTESISCKATIDGYSDFIFVNRFGDPQHQGTLNKALRRIIRDCNDEAFLQQKEPSVLLPHFSCHNLRHTFTTRMCEAGVNIKVIQDTLGHADVSTTLNIYTDVTKELKRSEFAEFGTYMHQLTGL